MDVATETGERDAHKRPVRTEYRDEPGCLGNRCPALHLAALAQYASRRSSLALGRSPYLSCRWAQLSSTRRRSAEPIASLRHSGSLWQSGCSASRDDRGHGALVSHVMGTSGG